MCTVRDALPGIEDVVTIGEPASLAAWAIVITADERRMKVVRPIILI